MVSPCLPTGYLSEASFQRWSLGFNHAHNFISWSIGSWQWGDVAGDDNQHFMSLPFSMEEFEGLAERYIPLHSVPFGVFHGIFSFVMHHC